MSFFRISCRILPNKNASTKTIHTSIDNNLLRRGKKGFVIAAAATAACSANKGLPTSAFNYYHHLKHFSSLQSKHNDMAAINNGRKLFVTQEITKNLTLCSSEPRNVDKDPNTLRLKQPLEKPLVVMFSWLLARKKHLLKYAKVYTDQGYDVLTVEITPWQLLWPTKGSQLVAADVIKFMENNVSYSPIILHGFSVGGYVWGECMVHMARDMDSGDDARNELMKYSPIINRIVAQVWDSAADITEIPVGVPNSIFPRNPTLQKALRNYTIYHLKTFHEQATTHYIRSSQIFHSTLVKAPALFFLSKNDPIGTERSNRSVHDDYESAGIKCTWKCWDRSGHVLHYQYHTDEYLQYLYKHLETYVMGHLSEKSRAKL